MQCVQSASCEGVGRYTAHVGCGLYVSQMYAGPKGVLISTKKKRVGFVKCFFVVFIIRLNCPCLQGLDWGKLWTDWGAV